jgi:phosphatidylserine/phosphatidylglycerophosphate/cardiolipin synthase-like enzyme
LGRFGNTSAALHKKVIVFDRKTVFLGSITWTGAPSSTTPKWA